MPRPARPWFRVYSETLDNIKVQQLPVAMRWHWLELLCLANINDPRGRLPALNRIAFRLRISEKQAEKVMSTMINARLVDEVDGEYVMHDWEGPDGWQYESDARATEGRQKRGDSAAESPQNDGAKTPDAPPRGRGEERRGETDTEGEAEGESDAAQNAAASPSSPASEPSAFLPSRPYSPWAWDDVRNHCIRTLGPLDDKARDILKAFYDRNPEWTMAGVNQAAGKDFGYLKNMLDDCFEKDEAPSSLRRSRRGIREVKASYA